jgi:hypothetical protein
MLEKLFERSGAVPLPDRDSALGNPFHRCEDLREYERNVLKVAVDQI